MLFDFFRYINTPNDYLEYYSTFLMTKEDLKSNILYHRMNVLINSYLYDKNKNKFDYTYYYMLNHKDNYLDKPLISNKVEFKNEPDYDRDVIDHYKFITTRGPKEPEIDYDELDKKFYEEELNKQKEKEEIELNDDNYYDDFDDYDDYDYELGDYDEYVEDFHDEYN